MWRRDSMPLEKLPLHVCYFHPQWSVHAHFQENLVESTSHSELLILSIDPALVVSLVWHLSVPSRLLQRLSVFCSRRGVRSLATRHHKTPWFAWLCSLLACWLCMPTSEEHRSSRTVREACALPHKGPVTRLRTGVVKALGWWPAGFVQPWWKAMKAQPTFVAKNFPRKWIRMASVQLKVKSAVRIITAVKLIPHCRWAVKRSALGRSRWSMSARPSWTTQANQRKDFVWPRAAVVIPWKTVAAKKVLKVPTWEQSSRGQELQIVRMYVMCSRSWWSRRNHRHCAISYRDLLQIIRNIAYMTWIIIWGLIDDEPLHFGNIFRNSYRSCTNLWWRGDKALRTCQLKFFDKPGQHGMAYSCAKEQA